MGASITVAHGMGKALGAAGQGRLVSVLGDSTFMHSGLTGLLNAVYNRADHTIIILDNRTTAMTGHQKAVAIRTLDARMRNKLPLLPDASESQQELRGIQIEVAKRVIMRLQSEMAESDIPTETYSALILEYQNFLSTLKAARRRYRQIHSR